MESKIINFTFSDRVEIIELKEYIIDKAKTIIELNEGN